MPSSAVSRTIKTVARADAFQLMRRMSSPRWYSRSEWNSVPVWPHDFIRRCWPSRPDDPTEGNGGGMVCGTISTSSVPANVVVRSVSPSTSRRRARSGPVRIRPRRAVGHPVGRAGGLAGCQLGQLHRCAAVVADRLPQLQVRRRLPAEVGELDVDARRLADRHHRRADDALDVERRQAALHRDHRDEQGDDDADAEHVQLDQAEDPPDDEARDGGDNRGPAVPGDHLATDGDGHRADDLADDRDCR